MAHWTDVFGGWTTRFVDEQGRGGHYSEAGKLTHCKEIDDATVRPGLSVFFHSNAWCQGPSAGQPVRYELGGDGNRYLAVSPLDDSLHAVSRHWGGDHDTGY